MSPDERADLLTISHVNESPLDLRVAMPGDAFVLGVVLQEHEIVVRCR